MAYNLLLETMIHDSLAIKGIQAEPKKMFGGVAFLVDGQMMIGIVKTDLMVRSTLERHEEVLGMPHCRPMDFASKPMKGFTYVAWEGLERNPDYLSKFVEIGWEFIQSPEAKAAAAKKAKKK